MTARPVVAVTGSSGRGYLPWRFTAFLLTRAGAIPRRVTVRRGMPAQLDALVVGGGIDVDPTLYGRPDATHHRRTDRARDDLELDLLDLAARKQLPVLGICRGAQLMNVYAGGTLLPDAYDPPQRWTSRPFKSIELDPGSHLAAILERTRCRVNSMHRNAVERLGVDLSVTARDDHGVIQAIEAPSLPFWIGVQWHPEFLPQVRAQRKLFRALVENA